jgi:cell division septum initiation protein DivIVA
MTPQLFIAINNMPTSSDDEDATVEIEVFLDAIDDVWDKIEEMEMKHKKEVERLKKTIKDLEEKVRSLMKRASENEEEMDETGIDINIEFSKLWKELVGCRVKTGRVKFVETVSNSSDTDTTLQSGGSIAIQKTGEVEGSATVKPKGPDDGKE